MTSRSLMSNPYFREKKNQKKKERAAAKPAPDASFPEKKKMRKSNSKENLFNHVDDDINAYLDAQEAKNCEKFEDTYETLSYPALDTRMTLSEYEEYLLREKNSWNLWKSHGLSRKQYDDHDAYENNCKTLRNLTRDDPEYEVLLSRIHAFEDEMDARAKEEETKLNEWFLSFEANNPELMARILQSSGANI